MIVHYWSFYLFFFVVKISRFFICLIRSRWKPKTHEVLGWFQAILLMLWRQLLAEKVVQYLKVNWPEYNRGFSYHLLINKRWTLKICALKKDRQKNIKYVLQSSISYTFMIYIYFPDKRFQIFKKKWCLSTFRVGPSVCLFVTDSDFH